MQSVEDFLKNGGSITTVGSGVKAKKKTLTPSQIAEKHGLKWDQEMECFIDQWGNWIPADEKGQPNWDGCE